MKFLYILTTSFLIFFVFNSFAQEEDQRRNVPPKSKKELKEQRKLEKQLAKDRAKVEKDRKVRESAELERAKQRHDAIQSKETRKRMKKRRKNAGKNYGRRKPSLWERLFGKKKKKRKRKRR